LTNKGHFPRAGFSLRAETDDKPFIAYPSEHSEAECHHYQPEDKTSFHECDRDPSHRYRTFRVVESKLSVGLQDGSPALQLCYHNLFPQTDPSTTRAGPAESRIHEPENEK
jgi:hypothetical protein